MALKQAIPKWYGTSVVLKPFSFKSNKTINRITGKKMLVL